MGGKRDLKGCKNDLRYMRGGKTCKFVQAELKAIRRSLKRKVKVALQQGKEPPAAAGVPYMY